jgi:hypothetical protein
MQLTTVVQSFGDPIPLINCVAPYWYNNSTLKHCYSGARRPVRAKYNPQVQHKISSYNFQKDINNHTKVYVRVLFSVT